MTKLFHLHAMKIGKKDMPNVVKEQIRELVQLDNYIDHIRKDANFQDLGNLVDLSIKLVQTRRHIVHNFVHLLLKLALILPTTTDFFYGGPPCCQMLAPPLQQSGVSIYLRFQNQGINPVGENAQVTEYLHKQTPTCTQCGKGLSIPSRLFAK